MNSTIATPPPPTPAVRRFVAWAWSDPDSRSTTVGVAAVVIYLLFMWFFGPRLLRIETLPPGAVRPHAAPKTFSIELAPDAPVKPAPKPADPFKFVETNPDAPENIPDRTSNFGAQNQQVAQEKPTPDGKSDRPATEGKKDFDSTQIVSGQLSKPVEHQEAVPEEVTPPVEVKAAAPKAEQNPLAGFDKKEGEDKDSFGSNIAKLTDNARPIPEKIDGAKDVPNADDAVATQPAIDPLRPRPRPTVTKQQQVRPAILAENRFGTSNIGNIAYDAKWSSYGEYLQRFINIVQIEWERILITLNTYPPSGSTVAVKFILDSDGKIARIVNVDNHSTAAAERACISGITNRAPYGPWTDDMKAMLGNEQELTFTFYYQ